MAEKPVRRKTRMVNVRGISIGGSAPITVQSMLNVPTSDIRASLDQIRRLRAAGCDIIRIAIRDERALKSFKVIREEVDVPLVADIHFDYKLAIGAVEMGADKLRINPGNIGSVDRVKEIAGTARDKGIPIRVGVNAGSLPDYLPAGLSLPERMVRSAEMEIRVLEDVQFEDIVISLKSHNPLDVIEANHLFSTKYDYPLHLGVTEAGLSPEAHIKGTLGIGALLLEGIGDTIRFSITGDPVDEVIAGKSLLRACGLTEGGIDFVSCPVCGRCRVDLAGIAKKTRDSLPETEERLVVAVMGCEVNGPGEAREADIGIAGGQGDFILFVDGEIVRRIPEDSAVEVLIGEVDRILDKK